jgi:hypothetical protein
LDLWSWKGANGRFPEAKLIPALHTSAAIFIQVWRGRRRELGKKIIISFFRGHRPSELPQIGTDFDRVVVAMAISRVSSLSANNRDEYGVKDEGERKTNNGSMKRVHHHHHRNSSKMRTSKRTIDSIVGFRMDAQPKNTMENGENCSNEERGQGS